MYSFFKSLSARTVVMVMAILVVGAISAGMAGAYGITSVSSSGYGGGGYESTPEGDAFSDAYADVTSDGTYASFSPDSATAGKAATFTSYGYAPNGSPVKSYSWNFGDATAAGSGATPQHTYAAVGEYDVVLTITFGDDQTAVAKETVKVVKDQPTSLSQNSNPLTPGVNQDTAFTASAFDVDDPQKFPVSGWAWNFGDGNGAGSLSSLQNPHHTYTAAGHYRVSVTATFADNSTKTSVRYIDVTPAPAPVASISYSQDPQPGVATTAFYGYVSGSSGATSYAWDIGNDGVTDGTVANPSLTFAAAGPVLLKLTIGFSDGSSVSKIQTVYVRDQNSRWAHFQPSLDPAKSGVALNIQTSAADPTGANPVQSYVYDWNDGTPDQTVPADTNGFTTVPHTFTTAGDYIVGVTATFEDNSTATYQRTVIVNEASHPQVSFFTQGTASPGHSISLQAYTSDVDHPTNTASTYSWNFGDGSDAGTVANPSHTWADAGEYEVTLTVTFSQSPPVTYSSIVTVYASSGTPATEFYSLGTTKAGEARPFQASTTYFGPPGTTGPTYAWNFGDGHTGTGVSPTNTYTTPGVYKATVTTTFPNGLGTSSRSHWVTVVPDRPGTAGFSWRSLTPVDGTIVTFTGSGIDPDDYGRTVTSYAWDFGGGDTASGNKPTRTLSAGDHPVTLTVTFDNNQTAQKTHVVHVDPVPAGADVKSEAVDAGATVSTGGGAPTPTNPVVTAVKTPVAGAVTLLETGVDQAAPSGYTFLGQQVNITAPNGTAANPLELTFTVDSSQLPAGGTASNLEVFRNGLKVPDCAQPAGQAQTVLPCVINRATTADGDVQITVLTIRASAWNFAKGSVDHGTGTPVATTGDNKVAVTAPATPAPAPAKPAAPAVKALTLAATVVKAKLAAALAKGLKATVKSSGAGTVTAQLKLDAKTAKKLKLKGAVATAKATFTKAGSKAVVLKFTAKAKKALKKAKTVKFTLVIVSGKTQTTKIVSLKR